MVSLDRFARISALVKVKKCLIFFFSHIHIQVTAVTRAGNVVEFL